jgi:integrase
MAFTGCRRGEALGLRWSDVDLENSTASIVQTLQRLKGKGLVFQSPKSDKSRRSIALDTTTIELLREHRGQQLLYQVELGEVYQNQGLVFPGPLGGSLDPSVLTRNFEKLASKAGLPGVRLHDLRHFHATLLLKTGTHPKIVQERLGHSSISITLDTYSHVVPGLQEQAAQAFDAAMKNAQEEPASASLE